MSLGETLVAALDGATTAGDRIHPLMLPGPDPVLPAVVYQQISEPHYPTHDGGGIVKPRVQLSTWASSYAAATALRAEVRSILDGARFDGVLFLEDGARDDEDEATRSSGQIGRCRVLVDYVTVHARGAAA